MINNQLPPTAFPIHFGYERRQGTGLGLGLKARIGIIVCGGAASTHHWGSPKDKLIFVTLQQIMPCAWETEFGLKKIIYDAIPN